MMLRVISGTSSAAQEQCNIVSGICSFRYFFLYIKNAIQTQASHIQFDSRYKAYARVILKHGGINLKSIR